MDRFDRQSLIKTAPKGVPRWALLQSGFRVPNVLTFTETLRAVADGERSLARFGDGERVLMLDNEPIPFQPWTPKISDELKRVIANADGYPCDIGVNRAYLYTTGAEQEQVERFYAEYELPRMQEDRYLDHMTLGQYLDASFTIPYHHYRKDAFPAYFFRDYFRAFAEIFDGRDVILAAGNGVIDEWAGMQNDILCKVKRIEIIRLPDTDAYEVIDAIEARLYEINPNGDRLVVLSCGPAATILAYRLSPRMRALDIGHALREFDRVMRGVPPTDYVEFFAN